MQGIPFKTCKKFFLLFCRYIWHDKKNALKHARQVVIVFFVSLNNKFGLITDQQIILKIVDPAVSVITIAIYTINTFSLINYFLIYVCVI